MANLTIGLMEPALESASVPAAFRLIDAALRRGHNVNVFCYEGAVTLGHARQTGHADPVSGHPQEQHPATPDWVHGLFDVAKQHRVSLRWINCGLCVDERGVDAQVAQAERGGPEKLWEMAEASDGFVFIGTK